MKLPPRPDSTVRISIVIPCYNREKLLVETLNSVQSQTFPAWEAIVIDDLSEDNSAEVARGFAGRDSRFRVVSRRGRNGANTCRNQGLSLARADYVIFLDSDDLLAPTALERRVTAMDKAPSAAFGVYQTEIFHERIGDSGLLCNAFNHSNDLHRFLSFDAVWHTAGPIWRKEVIKELGGFDEELLSFQDLDLHVRALIAGLKHFKVSIRDHFYRMGRGHGNAIALRSSTDPDHLRSHERLFEKIETLLRTAGLLDTDARYELVGMYWWLATRYRVHVSWKEACRVWRKCYHLGLLSRRRYGEGLLVTLLAVVRGGRHLGRLVQRFWPAQYHQLHSKDFHTNPVSSLDGAVIWSTEFQAAGKLKGDSHVRNKSLLP